MSSKKLDLKAHKSPMVDPTGVLTEYTEQIAEKLIDRVEERFGVRRPTSVVDSTIVEPEDTPPVVEIVLATDGDVVGLRDGAEQILADEADLTVTNTATDEGQAYIQFSLKRHIDEYGDRPDVGIPLTQPPR